MDVDQKIWNASWAYIAVLEFLALLASLTVGLRFWSRYISGRGTYIDDWLALATVLTQHGLNVLILIGFLGHGLGIKPLDVAAILNVAKTWPDYSSSLEKLLFAGTLLYGLSSTTIRLAVVVFYFRVLPSRSVKTGGCILATICILWFIAAETFALTTCKPVAYVWDKINVSGHCIDRSSAAAGTVAIVATNVAIDAATVVLPIREIIKLRLSKHHCYMVWSIVMIGVIATLASLGRLVAVVIYLAATSTHGGTTSAALSATTGFEVYISIIAASLPTLIPIYNKFFKHTPSGDDNDDDDDAPMPNHRYTRGSSSKNSLKKSAHAAFNVHAALENTGHHRSGRHHHNHRDEDERRPLKRYDDGVPALVPAKARGDMWTAISGARRPSSQVSIPVGGIRVQRDVTWEE